MVESKYLDLLSFTQLPMAETILKINEECLTAEVMEQFQIKAFLQCDVFSELFEKVDQLQLLMSDPNENQEDYTFTARCRVQYHKHFPSLSYLATYFTSL